MKQTQIRRAIYYFRHHILTMNNIVVIVALIIAAGWAIGSVNVLKRNYNLQAEINSKNRDLKLAELETATLKYQQAYYNSDEYKELAVRQRLGLGFPDEKVLILPPNSAAAKASDTQTKKSVPQSKPSNTEQWMDFLFGGGASGLQS